MPAFRSKNPLARSLRFAVPAVVATILLAAGGTMMSRLPAHAEEQAFVIPKPAFDQQKAEGLETARLAGGCFWGVQGVFQHVKGVTNAVSGYAGGAAETATYEGIQSGTTGHTETVEVTFDPSVISYGEILQIYFSVAHDPQQLNRQGPDSGTQYRSAIFPTSAEQKEVAARYIEQLDKTGVYASKIATTIEEGEFYPAEAYHQDFMVNNPTYPYIVINDLPKVENLKAVFPAVFSEKPMLVASAKS